MTINVVHAIAALGAMGIVFALLLGIASKVFAVSVDERIPKVQACLPGANCGGCGYPGCEGLASAIVAGKAPVNGCPVGGAAAADKIAEILGVSSSASEKMVAFVHCSGGCDAVNKFTYEGLSDCRADMRVGSSKLCASGCLGHGNCVKVCPFHAIRLENGVAVVDREKCTACQKCIAECPKKLISLVPYKNPVAVACASVEKGPAVINSCATGCIGCKKCETVCKFSAITVENNFASIDYTKCVGCKLCTKACPRNVIIPRPTPEEKEKFAAVLKAQAAKHKQKSDTESRDVAAEI